MRLEEFKNKLASDEALRKAFEADPMKVVQENNVELSEDELTKISGGIWLPGEKKPKGLNSSRPDPVSYDPNAWK